MSELAGYYGAVTSTVSFLLPWAVCIILAIMLLRLIQVIIHLNFVFFLTHLSNALESSI